MSTIKLGLLTLLITITLNFFLISMSSGYPYGIVLVTSIIGYIANIVGWYLLINVCNRKSIRKSLYVMSFYLIPYVVISLISYNSIHSEKLKDVFYVIIWNFISKSFIPVFIYDMNLFFVCIFPILNLTALFLINIYYRKNFIRNN